MPHDKIILPRKNLIQVTLKMYWQVIYHFAVSILYMSYTLIPECPEEVVDNRSLYERLQEQKDKKEQEYQDQFALSESHNTHKALL